MTSLEKLQNYALFGPFANAKQQIETYDGDRDDFTEPSDISGTDEPGKVPYEETPGHALWDAAPGAWGDWSDMDPNELINMDDYTKLNMIREMTGVSNMSMDEMYQYMPQYDLKGFRDIQTQGAQKRRKSTEKIAGVGVGKRTDLLSQAVAKDKSIRKGGFASTGNPMIDKQRESIYQDVDVTQETQWNSLLDDVWTTDKDLRLHKEDFQQKFGERMIDYEDKIAQDEYEQDMLDKESCFIAGTKVIMADGVEKNIEDIKVGELVKGMSGDNTVIKLDYTVLGNRRLYSINNGNYFVTSEHPFMTKEGWKSINPNATIAENHEAFPDKESIGTLDVGDILVTTKEDVIIDSISLKSGDSNMPLYNFYLSGDSTYSADGYFVHNKCCFIVLELEEGTGLDKYVRQYRDMAITNTNREGYYKLAQVIVPLMRKYKLAKWFFKYTFVKPAKSFAKWYYTGKGIGWVFEPLRKFWLNTFDYLGHKHKLKTDE